MSSSVGTPPPTSFHSIPLTILDDLASRFIINIPEEERRDIIRIMFQMELAKWFYDDEYVNSSAELTSCSMRDFCEHMFRRIPFLKRYTSKLDGVMEDWKAYKMAVPTYGAILIDPTLSKVLLVQGWWSKNSWGFPKGKVNEDEPPEECAVREVEEETNANVADQIDERHFLEKVISDQTVRLYLAPGVPEDTEFGTRTKQEIRDWRWYPIADLPLTKKDPLKPNCLNVRNWNAFYMVMPFVRDLRQWIKRYKRDQIEFTPGYRERKATRKQSAAGQGKKKRKDSKSYGDGRPAGGLHQQQQQKGQGQQTQSHQPQQQGNPAQSEEFECPRYWSNFRFNRKDIMASMAAAPGWN